MKKLIQRIVLFLVTFLAVNSLSAQNTVVKGKVTDAETGEGVPFANVYFIKTFEGTTTDFEGRYTFTTNNPSDSLAVSNVGYSVKSKPVQKGITQTINFQISPATSDLTEIVVSAGENPAHAIMRSVIENKSLNDKRRLESYNYESYTKIEIDVNNMSDKFREKKALRPITKIFDNLEMIAGEDGTPVLPVFFSESISEFYFRKNPKRSKEIVKASKVTGIGMDDGTFLTQIIGPTFQEYNFYENWMKILDKDFVSPIAASWKNYYHYFLMDSMMVGDHFCYKIDIEPKREQDLAFNGAIWIDKETSALVQIDVTVGKSANLNYIEKIKMQQKLEPTEDGAWIPVKNRILIDIAEVNENWAGMIAKFYTSNEKVEVNNTKDIEFYEEEIEVVENVIVEDEDFWQERRHDTLTTSEMAVFAMVDSMRNMPIVKTYVDIIYFVVNGHQRLGKHFEIGPYVTTYANNNIEGHRFRLGIRSTLDFSKKSTHKRIWCVWYIG